MRRTDGTPGTDDPYDLERFVAAQRPRYGTVLAELNAGRKRTHWMWFVFPQVRGLGHSATSMHYAIGSLEEAKRYLAHPVLGARLAECAEALLAIDGRSASEIFGSPDDLKLRSSMTLFAEAAGTGSVFERVLQKYYGGRKDVWTLALLRRA